MKALKKVAYSLLALLTATVGIRSYRIRENIRTTQVENMYLPPANYWLTNEEVMGWSMASGDLSSTNVLSKAERAFKHIQDKYMVEGQVFHISPNKQDVLWVNMEQGKEVAQVSSIQSNQSVKWVLSEQTDSDHFVWSQHTGYWYQVFWGKEHRDKTELAKTYQAVRYNQKQPNSKQTFTLPPIYIGTQHGDERLYLDTLLDGDKILFYDHSKFYGSTA